jgi:hypothetical protein
MSSASRWNVHLLIKFPRALVTGRQSLDGSPLINGSILEHMSLWILRGDAPALTRNLASFSLQLSEATFRAAP